jgi:hypothetical protein
MPVALTVAASGCAVRPYGAYHAGLYVDAPTVELGYEPMLYDGYVVYYTDASVPFYWVNGVEVYVPEAHRGVYVDHYHQHRDAYYRWDVERGPQYRGTRYPRREGAAAQQREGREGRRAEPTREGERAQPQAAPERERAQPRESEERERRQPGAVEERERPQPQAEPERRQPQPSGQQEEEARKKKDKDKNKDKDKDKDKDKKKRR